MNILPKLFIPTSSESNKTKTIFTLLIILIISFFFAVFFGSANADLTSAVKALLSGDFTNPNLRIFLYIRIPRATASVIAGAALAVSGVIIQAVLNNSMASPNIIGVNSGAGFAVSIMSAIFPAMSVYIPFAAFFGAFGACLLIYLISIRTNSSRMTITLVGITVSSILSAGINAIKTVFPDSIYNTNTFMVGGFSGVSFDKLILPGMLILSGIVIAEFMGKDIDILSLGEETATSLGMNVKPKRFILLMIASILAGSAVSFAGLLGFVGLLGPHIARRFVSESHKMLIPVSAVTGSILVIVCDFIGRVMFAPYELPVGIIMSFVGGPFFIFLILRQRKVRVYD